ncbi:hypothetical protein H4R19_000824 [Coemansia spiralis]|nr:hypothetical protein H4R19_000824 [Coemansia spiralis]
MDVLDRYLERLFFLGSQRLVDTAVDEAVVRISTEEPPQSSAGSMIAVNNERPMPSIHDVTAVDMEMATIYMRYRAYEFADLRTLCEQPISASKVLWLLYQAGYIVPSNRSQMIIPNAEVLVELRHYQQRVARLHHR